MDGSGKMEKLPSYKCTDKPSDTLQQVRHIRRLHEWLIQDVPSDSATTVLLAFHDISKGKQLGFIINTQQLVRRMTAANCEFAHFKRLQ